MKAFQKNCSGFSLITEENEIRGLFWYLEYWRGSLMFSTTEKTWECERIV